MHPEECFPLKDSEVTVLYYVPVLSSYGYVCGHAASLRMSVNASVLASGEKSISLCTISMEC